MWTPPSSWGRWASLPQAVSPFRQSPFPTPTSPGRLLTEAVQIPGAWGRGRVGRNCGKKEVHELQNLSVSPKADLSRSFH